MQHEITARGPLLDEQGHLTERGFARSLLRDYRRKDIRANALRIKEWDYYAIVHPDYCLAMTIADNSYMGLYSVSLLDLREPWYKTSSKMRFMTCGRTNLPSSSAAGDVRFESGKTRMEFRHQGELRRLKCRFDCFMDGKPLFANITLQKEPPESTVIVTPFSESPKAFYYNQKINCIPASGTVEFNGRTYKFRPEDSFAVLDWGRGVWPYRNTWYWGSASGLADGIPFGFNIGYGFGDTSAATENMLLYDGCAHKLTDVTFHIPQKNGRDDFLSPWKFTSSDGRFEMDFTPVIDRADETNALLIASYQHQVFGRFSGTAVLDDGRKITVRDLTGFAEKVANRW